VVYRSKRLILEVSLASELHMLAHQLDRLAQKGRHSRDFTLNSLRDALREVVACFPVYRSYIAGGKVHETDRKYVQAAVRRAAARNSLMSRSLFRFIRDMLLLEYPEGATEEDRAEQRLFAGKFQQVTAPVMAKGLEDTAFYVYNRLVSLNEVGGDPGRFGLSAEALHRFNQDRQARWPYSLSPLSTHDTKRGEDVRARINVLSEMPQEWIAAVSRWSRLNATHRQEVDEEAAPDANEEYLVYQTLLGAWPLEPYTPQEYAEFVRRIQEYMLKALHEAKVHTSWINPNPDYDEAVQEFVARVLDPEKSRAFLDDFQAFQSRVSHHGLLNSLAQTVLRLASPGVPDTYQGTELWDLSLVDPDNRRPVDYGRRKEILAELRSAAESAGDDRRALAGGLVAAREDGRVKLYVTWLGLRCRREHPGLFSAGEYLPVSAGGPQARHVFAFVRRAGGEVALAAVPRLPLRLLSEAGRLPLGEEVWQGTRLELPELGAGLAWRNVFTGEVLSPTEEGGTPGLKAAAVFAHFPVALLLAGGERHR
jgi:(1->4)-alpha-D-glucan 1-alpha-D-glucosylmutase